MAAGQSIVIFLVLLPVIATCHLQEVCIVSSEESLPSFCKNKTTTPLRDFCLNLSGMTDNTVVTFLGGTHQLSTTCEFTSVNSNITLRGQSNVTVNCSRHGGTGFRFLNVSEVMITGIEFKGCGAVATSRGT